MGESRKPAFGPCNQGRLPSSNPKAETRLEAELEATDAFSAYVAENKPEVSLDCHIAPTTLFNTLMVQLMPQLQAMADADDTTVLNTVVQAGSPGSGGCLHYYVESPVISHA